LASQYAHTQPTEDEFVRSYRQTATQEKDGTNFGREKKEVKPGSPSTTRQTKKEIQNKKVRRVREEPVHPSALVVDRHSSCNINSVSLFLGQSRTLLGITYSALPGIRLVHRRDFASNGSPFHFAAQRAAAALALELFPLEKFVSVVELSDLASRENLLKASFQDTYENLR
jgi:hypothetical protein